MTPLEWVLISLVVMSYTERMLSNWQHDKHRASDNLRWTEILNKLGESHAEELHRLGNMRIAGVPDIPPAKITPAPEQPEDRLGRMAREQSVQAGVDSLRAKYVALGQPITEDEARRQVENMLSGLPPL
jgi:hypothetical protein